MPLLNKGETSDKQNGRFQFDARSPTAKLALLIARVLEKDFEELYDLEIEEE